MKYTLKINEVSKKFGNRTIINNMSYVFESGKVYVLKGMSGSGKTTLLNIMSGLVKPDAGTVESNFGKVSANNRKWFRNKASYVFQNYALIDEDTVKQNLDIATRFKKENRSKERYLEALFEVGLSDILNQKIYELSGGEQQRVSIARLYLREFIIVFADEPTGNLDEKNTEIILRLFRNIADNNKIVIITSHNETVINAADEVIEL